MMLEISDTNSTLSEDKKLEVLNDHYKDSFSHLQKFLRNRDKLFFFILITITLMLYQIFSPLEAKDVIGHLITKALNLDNMVDASFIGSIIWFALLALIVRYFQTVVYIETQYKYIHHLEDQLCPYYNNKAFTREGKTYLKDYNKFSKWIKKLYFNIFPALLIFVIIAKIYNEIIYARSISVMLIFNISIFILIIIFVSLYLQAIHSRR